MITFSGKLNRAGYWKTLVISVVGLIIVSGTLLWLLDIQDGEIVGASAQSQILAVIFGLLYFASLVFFFAMILSAIFRRAHDISNSLVWVLVGLFVPFGFIVIGLLPPRS